MQRLLRFAPTVQILIYSDKQFMIATGARVEEAVWKLTGITVDENDRPILE